MSPTQFTTTDRSLNFVVGSRSKNVFFFQNHNVQLIEISIQANTAYLLSTFIAEEIIVYSHIR